MPTEEEVQKAEKLLDVSRYDELNIVTKKYRVIIRGIHPDKGGVGKQAGQINASLDIIKDFKKMGVRITNTDLGFSDCTSETFIHPLRRKSSRKDSIKKNVFDDLEDILKSKLNVRQEDINKANVAAKKVVEVASGSIKQKLIKIGANLLSEYFIKGNKGDFKLVVIKAVKGELKNIKTDISDEFKTGVLSYFNNLLGMKLTLDDLSDTPKTKKRVRKPKKECKIHTIEGTASKLDLKRLMNKNTATITCSIKSSKGYFINKRLHLYYIEKIYKKDSIMVICRDNSNRIYKILTE